MIDHLMVNISSEKLGFHWDVHFQCSASHILGIMGESGVGKTFLLRSIAGLENNISGEICVNNHTWLNSKDRINVPAYKRKVGYVFQEARLFPHLTVRQNILFKANKETKLFTTLVEKFNIQHLLDRTPHRLSGGEQQRVAIARALLSNPDLLLMDEPLSALDKSLRNSLIDLMKDIFCDLKIPVIYVSHDAHETQALCQTTICLPNRRSFAENADT